MKKFTIEVSHASPAQLTTIALDLKITCNGYTKHGPQISINGRELQAPRLRIPGSGRKRQAASPPPGGGGIKAFYKKSLTLDLGYYKIVI